MRARTLAMVLAVLVVAGITLTLLSSSASAATSSRRVRAYEHALSQQGCWYVWAGTGPCSQGYDCSGLMVASYLSVGMGLPRSTTDMLGSRALKKVRHRNTHVGMLAFFGTGHVEMVAGKHWTIGALEPGTRVGMHHWTWDSAWRPTAFYKVRDAG